MNNHISIDVANAEALELIGGNGSHWVFEGFSQTRWHTTIMLDIIGVR